MNIDQQINTFIMIEKEPILILDYDGTLAPFKQERMEAFIHPEIKTFFQTLIDKNKIIIVSGRSIHDLEILLEDFSPIELYGSHGHEHKSENNTYTLDKMNYMEQIFFDVAHELAENENLYEHLEFKPCSIAVHFRDLQEKTIHNLKLFINNLNKNIPKSMKLKKFNGGYEFIISSKNKGNAIIDILSSYNTEKYKFCFIGDDLTDEDGFKALKNKGLSILFSEINKPTNANIQLNSYPELITFLKMFI